MNFSGKTVLVTGAGKGIGRATAAVFAAAGANLVLTDINFENVAELEIKLKQDLATKCIAATLDVTKKDMVDSVVKMTEETFGGVDILVNNAGICQKVSFEDCPWSDWQKLIDVNVGGAVLCTQAVIKYMKERRHGKIINVSSVAGAVGGVVAGPHYAASKAAINCLTMSLAKAYASFNINVNAVAPGCVKTDMAVGLGHDEKMVPLSRLGEPEDIAKVILFLASDDANYITGATIDVNGGMFMK